jgi:hypothetical protein
MQTTVTFEAGFGQVNRLIQDDSTHQIKVSVDAVGNYVLFECATREALFEMGRTLMHEALFGAHEVEFFPLGQNGEQLVVSGVRLSAESARVFVHFPDNE